MCPPLCVNELLDGKSGEESIPLVKKLFCCDDGCEMAKGTGQRWCVYGHQQKWASIPETGMNWR